MSRILVVEDDEFMLKTIEYAISNQDVQVTAVTNGKEALKFARKMIFDLVISDINMPLMNGHDFVKKFRQLPEYKLTPFIFLSGNQNNSDWMKGLAQGADDYIKKPFDPQLLMAKVNANLKRVRLHKKQLSIRQEDNLGTETGMVLFCSSSRSIYKVPTDKIDAQVEMVTNEATFFEIIESKNTWLIVIDEFAGWPFRIMKKLKKFVANKHIPICILVSKLTAEDKLVEYANLGISKFLFKDLYKDCLSYEINAHLEGEKKIKEKYLSAINIAAQNSPIRLENEYNQRLNNIVVSCFHQSYQNLPGGDYYEVFHMGENKKLVAVGDVMGKEWGAWFFVAGYLAYLRGAIHFVLNSNDIKLAENPGEILAMLNNIIFKDTQLSEAFSTLSLLYIDGEKSEVILSSAGGLAPVYYEHSLRKLSSLKVKGTLVGLIEDSFYQNIVIPLQTGDRLVVFTDGYSEATAKDQEELLGIDGVEEIVGRVCRQSNFVAKEFDKTFKTQHQVENFLDDRTLLIVSHE